MQTVSLTPPLRMNRCSQVGELSRECGAASSASTSAPGAATVPAVCATPRRARSREGVGLSMGQQSPRQGKAPCPPLRARPPTPPFAAAA
eukprot:366072-Chlamydomonas_euryale.AAC.7